MIDETNKGRRVELIFTDDKRTDLKPGAKGTYQYANVSDSHTHPTQHSILWDSGSRPMMVEGVDQFRFLN